MQICLRPNTAGNFHENAIELMSCQRTLISSERASHTEREREAEPAMLRECFEYLMALLCQSVQHADSVALAVASFKVTTELSFVNYNVLEDRLHLHLHLHFHLQPCFRQRPVSLAPGAQLRAF